MSYRSTKRFFYIILAFVLNAATLHHVSAQTTSGGIQQLIAAINSFGRSRAPEKLYLQLDKPYYAVGDTIWFKAYVLQAGLLMPSTKSGIMYVELANIDGKVVKRLKIPVKLGLSWGQLALNEGEIEPGNYTLRAYTNWQRNFNENFEFKTYINIVAVADDAWLAKSHVSTEDKPGGKHVNVGLTLTQSTDNRPVSQQKLNLKVLQDNKVFHKSQLESSADGTFNVGFYAPAVGKNLQITIDEQTAQGIAPRQLMIPVALAGEDIDLQFMPEGGHLVAGLPTRVGFKAVDNTGLGVTVNGSIKNSKGEQVASLKSAFAGIGSFEFTPVVGESYTAFITSANGGAQSYPLPTIQNSGIAMRMRSKPQHSDSLVVMFSGTPDVIGNNNTGYYLIGHAQGIVCMAGRIHFDNGQPVKAVVNTKLFPSGVAMFTLFNAADKPVCERAVYIDHRHQLKIKLITSQKSYKLRDSVAVDVEVADEQGRPVTGDFSVAVTDNGQVKQLGANTTNMVNRLLLADELRGEIEQPGYYFDDNGTTHFAELDNLMLTNGWTSYNWTDFFEPKPIQYNAEPYMALHGRVTNVLNKGVINGEVILLSKRPSILTNTLTDGQGKFTFGPLPFLDSAANFLVQAKNKNGKDNGIGIDVDEWQPPVFASSVNMAQPWYVNSDTTVLNYNKTKQLQQLQLRKQNGRMMGEVNIVSKKIVKGSRNLNGPGNADFILDEQDLYKAGNMPLLTLLEQKINGFHVGTWPVLHNKYGSFDYMVNIKRAQIIFNGVDIDKLYDEANNTVTNGHYEFVKEFLNYYTAADIKGVELVNTSKYDIEYNHNFHPITTIAEALQFDIKNNYAFAYIEITSKSGDGPYVKHLPGSTVYRYQPFSFPKDFYRPRYAAKRDALQLPDLRSTIHWQPNLVTDSTGKATVSFYAADKPGSYTIIIEGTDLKGRLGSQTGQIMIVK